MRGDGKAAVAARSGARGSMRGAVLAGVLIMLLAGTARAEPYFDTLGALGDVYEDTDVFSLVGDWTDFGGGVDSDWYQGFRFASAASGPVHSIDVGVGYLAMPETMVFYLHEDDAGSLGALLATFEARAIADSYDGSIERAVPATLVQPVLQAGATYWLMVGSDTATLWFNNELGIQADRLWTPNGVGAALRADTTNAAAFRVNGPPGPDDPDNDRVPQAEDNCPDWPNTAQADADGNGIGDACECGDQNGDGVVNIADLLAINEVIFELQPASPLCDTNDDGLCDVADILGANGKIFGQPAYCARFPAP